MVYVVLEDFWMEMLVLDFVEEPKAYVQKTVNKRRIIELFDKPVQEKESSPSHPICIA